MIYFRFYFFHLISSKSEIIVGSNVSGSFLLASPNMLQEFWPIPLDITLRTESNVLALLLTDIFLFIFDHIGVRSKQCDRNSNTSTLLFLSHVATTVEVWSDDLDDLYETNWLEILLQCIHISLLFHDAICF